MRDRKIGNWLARTGVAAICCLSWACTSTSYVPPPGSPTANVRFRELNGGAFYLYLTPRLPRCVLPSDLSILNVPIGSAYIRPSDDKTIVLIPFHPTKPKLGMPIDGDYVDGSYFEIKMEADRLLNLWVRDNGHGEFDTAFRFTPKSGESYEVTVEHRIPLKVHVDRISSQARHFYREPVEDLEVLQRCASQKAGASTGQKELDIN